MRVTFGTARNAAPVFRPWSRFLPTSTRSRRCLLSRFAQRLRQLGKISRNAPRLIVREQFCRRFAAPLILEIKGPPFSGPTGKSSAVRCDVGNTTKVRRKLSAFSNGWGGEVK
jgi:hypothetical protein